MITWLIAAGGAFMIGSIPFGYLLARARGVDIRTHGSGNIGATNVGRVLGKRLGRLCLLLDVGKGLVPTLAAGLYHDAVGRFDLPPDQAWAWLGVMACPVLGHMFCPWLGFRGGKGVATGLGSVAAVFPVLTVPAVGAVVVWALSVRLTHYVGLSSCVAAASLPLFVGAGMMAAGRLDHAAPWAIATGVLAVLVVFKHRGNLARTFAGSERRVGENEHSS